MNTRDAMQALIDGKRLVTRGKGGRSTATVAELASDHVRDVSDGSRLSVFDWTTWSVYEKPNHNVHGSLAWAREEAKRGNEVKRPSWGGSWDDADFACGSLGMSDIDATDWERVP